jgi:hypothetical protein
MCQFACRREHQVGYAAPVSGINRASVVAQRVRMHADFETCVGDIRQSRSFIRQSLEAERPPGGLQATMPTWLAIAMALFSTSLGPQKAGPEVS